MKLLTVLLCSIAFQCTVYAQDCERIFIGEILDFHNQTPLNKASVQITGTKKVTLSNNKGKFTFANLCDGTYELEISHPECTTLFLLINIQGNTFQKIALEHHLEELDEVNVTADVIAKKSRSAQENHLKIETIERYSSKNLGDALKQINGVSSLNTGTNIVKPVIQGLNGSRVLILNNGVRLQDMEWGEEHAPNVDINSTNRISVIKGASALQYGGDAIGGVILMEQALIPAKDSLYGKTILNGSTNGRGGNISTELTKAFKNGWFTKIQGAFKRFGDSETPNYILSNTGVREIGASINLGKRTFVEGWDAYYSYFNTNIAILRASHIGNIDDLIKGINNGQPNIINDFTYAINSPNQEVTHHLGKLKYYLRFEGFGKWDIQYDVQNNRRFEYDIRVGNDKNKASIDLKLTTHTLSTNLKIDSKSDYKLNMGLITRYQNNFANPSTGIRRLIPDYDKYDFGAFVTNEYILSNSFILDAGIRYDFNRIDAKKFFRSSRWEERGYAQEFSNFIVEDLGTQILVNPIFDYHNISATLGFQYTPSTDNQLRFNYAFSQRAPNPSELFSDGLHHSAARIELGDLRMGNETSHKVSFSLQKENEKWGYEIAPYANFITDFIILEPTGVEFTIRGAYPVWAYRQTNAQLLGVDASIYSQWTGNWRTKHDFSLVKGKDKSKKNALINMPATNFRNSLTFSKKEWKNLNVTIGSEYIFRQNEYPMNITVFSPEQNANVPLRINTPPNAYHLLNADVEVKFPLSLKNNVTIGLAINNLLNEKYREYLNRFRYFADDTGRNFTLRIKFNY